MTIRRTSHILAQLADAPPGALPVADRLVAGCAGATAVTGVAVTFVTGAGVGAAATLAAGDPSSAAMEDLQFALGEGPSLESAATGRPAMHPDLARTGRLRYPVFTEAAAAAGTGAVLAFPLRVGAIRVGVLALYRDAAGPLTGPQLSEALSFADAATAVVVQMQSGHPSLRRGDDLARAAAARAVVHQATGFLSVVAGIGLGPALALIRAAAFSGGRPLADVARDVLDGTLLLHDDDG